WGAALAPGVAALVPEIEVLSASGGRVGGEPPARVHPVAASAPLPFASGAFRGVALASGSDALAEEGARVLGPSGRILVEGAPPGVAGRLEALGLRLLLDSEGAVVAERR
ncbi:MAG: hypothetical protein M3483_05875, partial [Gemmatimonadota bacterium]|nr:hypothetical protein [Gemmatimonadota bacterium]